jgi:ribosomal protein S18 acetylase RimI-like enzyme
MTTPVPNPVPSPAWRLRPATEEDVAFLADVSLEATRDEGLLPDGFDEAAWREGFDGWTRAQLRGEVEHSSTYVVEAGEEPAGRLRVVRPPEGVELAGLQLRPAYRSQGIGTAIIEQLGDEAASSGLPFRLSVERRNVRARALYERLGFVEVGGDGTEAVMERQRPAQ